MNYLMLLAAGGVFLYLALLAKIAPTVIRAVPWWNEMIPLSQKDREDFKWAVVWTWYPGLFCIGYASYKLFG